MAFVGGFLVLFSLSWLLALVLARWMGVCRERDKER